MLIPLQDIKIHLRLGLESDPEVDLYLADILDAATDYAEQYLGRPIPWSTDDASEVFPPSVRSAILLIITDLYENRNGQTVAVLNQNKAVENLLHFYRVGLGV